MSIESLCKRQSPFPGRKIVFCSTPMNKVNYPMEYFEKLTVERLQNNHSKGNIIGHWK